MDEMERQEDGKTERREVRKQISPEAGLIAQNKF